jgi:hypothetical protein
MSVVRLVIVDSPPRYPLRGRSRRFILEKKVDHLERRQSNARLSIENRVAER